MKNGLQEVNRSRNTRSVIFSLEAHSLFSIFPLSFALNPSCIERCVLIKKQEAQTISCCFFLTLDRNLIHRAQHAYFSSVPSLCLFAHKRDNKDIQGSNRKVSHISGFSIVVLFSTNGITLRVLNLMNIP